jgi:hypothetical protein
VNRTLEALTRTTELLATNTPSSPLRVFLYHLGDELVRRGLKVLAVRTDTAYSLAELGKLLPRLLRLKLVHGANLM